MGGETLKAEPPGEGGGGGGEGLLSTRNDYKSIKGAGELLRRRGEFSYPVHPFYVQSTNIRLPELSFTNTAFDYRLIHVSG
jgi:hypothetical protein